MYTYIEKIYFPLTCTINEISLKENIFVFLVLDVVHVVDTSNKQN